MGYKCGGTSWAHTLLEDGFVLIETLNPHWFSTHRHNRCNINYIKIDFGKKQFYIQSNLSTADQMMKVATWVYSASLILLWVDRAPKLMNKTICGVKCGGQRLGKLDFLPAQNLHLFKRSFNWILLNDCKFINNINEEEAFQRSSKFNRDYQSL